VAVGSVGGPQAAPSSRTAEFGRDALIVCDNLVRIYQTGSIEVQALQGLDLLVGRGELIAIVGASGSGKSTLLSVLAGADAPTAGRARVDGWDLLAMTNAERVRYRRHTVGFIRQQTARNLVPYLTGRQVVELPMTFAGTPRRARRRRAEELLAALRVTDCADRRPAQMSGGQQQRVAICVALANRPAVLLADEPTGELDTQTSGEVFAAFRRVNEELGVTVVIVTHDPEVSGQVERTVAIRDGRTSSEVLRRTTRNADGDDHVVAQEYAVMDRAGRVQVPREYREALALTERVRLALEPDHVAMWPDRENDRALDQPGEPGQPEREPER
jgi:putative ABC transport system ATP-binding protein